ncbi:hypothetical protein [Pseudomonas sp.]|uniref:hypothetical protein n=1 Tax=Pseudomonas sp. TaxID=306 RepID=UPI003D6E3ABC
MPTENLSSNTEQMVRVPRDLIDAALTDMPSDSQLGFELRAVLVQPAAQHQRDPRDVRLRPNGTLSNDIPPGQPGHISIGLLDANPPTSDGYSAGDRADQGAKAFRARDGEVEELRAALKFYADRDHFSEDMRGDWDNVSGEPANILWHEDEAWFVEDGSIARAALERQP